MPRLIWNDEKSRPEYRLDPVEKAGGKIADGLHKGLDFMTFGLDIIIKGVCILFAIGVAGYLAYIILADLVLGYSGIVKAKTPLTISVSEAVRAEEASIVTVSHRKKPDSGIFPIENGKTEVKTTTHNQSVYLSYDGMLVDSGYFIIPSIVEPATAAGTFETERAVLVSFSDTNGSAIPGNSVSVRCSDSDALDCTVLQDGRLVLLLPENSSDLTFTFSVDGYSSVHVSQDWNQYRSGILEVCFDVQ